MRLCLIVAIAAMTTLTLTAADVAGTSKGIMETQMGPGETIITIQSGEALAGTVKIAFYSQKTSPKSAFRKMAFLVCAGPTKEGFLY